MITRTLKEVAESSVSLLLGPDELWRIGTAGEVSRLYFEASSVQGFATDFKTLVDGIIEKRVRSYILENTTMENQGFLLVYDPCASLFDGFSSEETNGFFDDADAPPPEFWLGTFDDKLISFIPQKFHNMLELAYQGLAELCLTKYDNFKLLDEALTSDHIKRNAGRYN